MRDERHEGPKPLASFDVDEAGEDLFSFASSNKPRVPLGYSLDDTCGKMGLGELGLVWARSGAGKSTFVLNIIANTPDVPTAVFNMEMTKRAQWEWLLAMSCELETAAKDIEDVLRAGRDHPFFDEMVAGRKQMADLYRNLTFVSPTKAPTVDELRITLYDIRKRTGVKPLRVFVDHMTLLKGARDYEGVTTIAAELHKLSMKEDIALIVLQQTGRGGFDGGRNDGHLPVTLSSGIYAGEHDADWIWGLYRPEKDPRFFKQRHEFKKEEDYQRMLTDRDVLRNVARLQLIKNRPYGEINNMGLDLYYEPHNRRLTETTWEMR